MVIGQPPCRYQDPLKDRLRRVGISKQKIEDFSAWRQTISGLISSNTHAMKDGT